MNTLEQYEQKRLINQVNTRIETLRKKKTKKNKQEIELLKNSINEQKQTK